MKGVQIVEPNKLQIVDLEKPQIDKENNVLVRMVAAGICGSDVGIYHGTNAAATYPRIIGHENVGIVEEIGEGVTRVKVGDRVLFGKYSGQTVKVDGEELLPQGPPQRLRQPEGARRAHRRRLPRVHGCAGPRLLPGA